MSQLLVLKDEYKKFKKIDLKNKAQVDIYPMIRNFENQSKR